MIKPYDNYEIDDTLTRIDFDCVHGWLSNTYWSPDIARDKVEKAAHYSAVVIGVYSETGDQVGYARVVSDTVRFSYLADVYVEEAHRGHGVGRAIVRFAQEHPCLLDVRGMVLATADAHGVYEALGFTPLPSPEKWMRWARPQV